MSIETYGFWKAFAVEPCTCKALMRPRWIKDNLPRVFVCQRCGKPVKGYEELWVMRERARKRVEWHDGGWRV